MAQTSPRGVHDLGGLPGHEPIDREPHHDHSFEARTAAMLALLRHPARPLVIVDEMRRGIESLNADEYRGYSYYERWLESARRILLEKGVLDEAELQRKIDEVRRRLEGHAPAAPAAPKPKAGAPATKPKRRAAATAAKAPKRRSAAKRAAKRAAAPKRKAARKAVASRKPVAKAKPAAKRAAAKRTAAKRTVASKRAAPKRKPAPKRAASKRKAPARRKAAPKRAAARKTGAKGKPAARRTRR